MANEKQRLTEKRQALAKSEMDKRMADLVKFSQSFKVLLSRLQFPHLNYQQLNKPIPDDLVPILAKDEDKQKQIREKSNKDANSSQARNIGSSVSTHSVPARGPHITTAKVVEAGRKTAATATSTTKASTQATGIAASATNKAEATKPTKPVMFIQPIPPFKGSKRQSLQPSSNANGASNGTNAAQVSVATKAPVPNAPANRLNAGLNVKASTFNPRAVAFTPVGFFKKIPVVVSHPVRLSSGRSFSWT